MTLPDESTLAESQAAFLRHLSQRVEVIGRRLQRFLQSGWDINGLARIHREAGSLGQASARHQLDAPGEHLAALRELLSQPLSEQALPDPTLGERLWNVMENLRIAVPRAPERPRETTTQLMRALGSHPRSETPPPGYWRRWGDDAPKPTFVDVSDVTDVATALGLPPPLVVRDIVIEQAAPDLPTDIDFWSDPAHPPTQLDTLPGDRIFEREPVTERVPPPAARLNPPAPEPEPEFDDPFMSIPVRKARGAPAPPPTPAPAPAPAEPEPEPVAADATAPGADPFKLKVGPGFRIYHLSRMGPISLELDQRLSAQGHEVELLEDAAELKELLGAVPANLVLVDSGFTDDLEGVGESVRLLRQKPNTRLLLVAIAEADDIALRLSAKRAGADALVVAPTSANDVLKRLQQLVDPDREAPFRILVVEDDRSQALFAEGILRNAGMESQVVLDSLGVMPALESFQPDLILMDLHMPAASGIELTALIRENEAFFDTPIVFLSGESDQDRQFDAIDAGGDDFLAKPIRPRHLISAVQNRVRRHRAMASRRGKQVGGRNPQTGLDERADLLERVAAHLANGPAPVPGGLLYLEIESSSSLRERLGLSALEQLMTDVSKLLSGKCGDAAAARFGDASFLLFDAGRDEAALEQLAINARSALVQQPFQAQGHPLRLRVSVGVCALNHGFPDLAAALNAVEKVAREARTFERGVRRYEPPKAAEAQREASLLKQLREAVDMQHLELLYQPVVAVAGSDDSQFQVLLRLRDANGKLRSAAEIVPSAERAGFIVDIDRWVILQALALIRDRRNDGRPLRLFVTQSPLTLAAPGQSAWLKTELAAHEVPGTSLVIELRLQDAAVHAATVRAFCDAMVEDGTQFCLSQFESGGESEQLLEELPLGFVKLARKYTAGNMPQAVRDELKTLINRAHRRGLEVIGHGVEDAQAAATLWMSGIDFIQGNLVSAANQDLEFDFHQAVL
jgi:EAL domain-containing protein (putative c-di-GMP-specific phosphodiesterase class I)/PleD family two-component response regulator